MVVPRPVLIAILGGASIIAAFIGMRGLGAKDDEAVEPLPTAAQKPATEGASKPVAGKLSSGRVRMALSVSDLRGAPAGLGDGARLELSGAFQGQGPTAPPKFDLTLRASAAGDRYEIGAVSLGDRGYVSLDGEHYQLPEQAWAALTDLRTRVAALADASQGAPAQPLSDLGAYVTAKRVVGAGRIDGVEVVHSRGRVDVRHIAADVERLIAAQGLAGQLPSGFADSLAQIVDSSRVDLYEGRDGIARRVRVQLDLRVPAGARSDLQGLESARLTLSADISDVNRPQRITAPAGAQPITAPPADLPFATALTAVALMTVDAPAGVESIDSQAFQAAISGRPAPARKGAPVQAGEGVPGKVARALDDGRIVVLFFEQTGGGDDAATAASLRDIRRLRDRGVAVFKASVDDLPAYRRVVQDLGITQAPAIVVIGADREARVLEGYTDSGTLAQTIRDAGAK